MAGGIHQVVNMVAGDTTINNGGFSELCFADTRTEPYVFASECEWFLDDGSWFVFLKQPDGKFYAHRLKYKTLYSVDRDRAGNPVITAQNYSEGEMLTWSGKKWISRDLTKNIKSHLKKAGYAFDDDLNFRELFVTAISVLWGKCTGIVSQWKIYTCTAIITLKTGLLKVLQTGRIRSLCIRIS